MKGHVGYGGPGNHQVAALLDPYHLFLIKTLKKRGEIWQLWASVGKRLLTIYVTDEAGRRLGLGRSLARSFAKHIFNSFYLGLVSLITIAVRTKKQALHDYAAKTLVVNGRPSVGGSLELWRIVAAFGIQFLLFVVTFTVLFRTMQ